MVPEVVETAKGVSLLFDYSSVVDQDRKFVMAAALRVKLYASMAVTGLVLSGTQLREVKARLPYGQWEEWLRVEIGINDRTARAWMQASRFVEEESVSDTELEGFTLDALRILASRHTPHAVRTAAVDAVKNGTTVTRGWLEGLLPPPAVRNGSATTPGSGTGPAGRPVLPADGDDWTPADVPRPPAAPPLPPPHPALDALLFAPAAVTHAPAARVAAEVPAALRAHYRLQAQRIAEWCDDLVDELGTLEGVG